MSIRVRVRGTVNDRHMDGIIFGGPQDTVDAVKWAAQNTWNVKKGTYSFVVRTPSGALVKVDKDTALDSLPILTDGMIHFIPVGNGT